MTGTTEADQTPHPPRRGHARAAGVSCAIALMLVAAACSSSKKASTTTTSPTTASVPKGSGPVDVASAGSLQDLMNNQIGPAFDKATGYSFSGTSGDSGTLATEIEAGTQVADIYISANPAKNAGLMGTANKSLVSWYAEWATSPLVIGYSPTSKFATDLKTMPWYQVLTMPGILIGRTDPASDPAGALAVTALTAAATKYNEPALTAITTATSNIYPETTLVGRLQSGQLDVGFFYDIEAKAASPALPTVPLTGDSGEAAMYTITILNNAPHLAGSAAFVEYLLGDSAKPILAADGLALVSPPTVTGTGVPSALSMVLHS